ncbi:hypothetical protein E2L08_12545 [Palleronia sediminis]|uniref:Uncharacterized protein n=1 Tax=Palleronia sediminis TaxID=2547833 RepID=A0A4R6A5U7_9RHOB|nr:hypothetical protein [Palleronia sediminis]TDL78122.1 hypothetical protein E2L08_12545 [Palleronia sediminis]
MTEIATEDDLWKLFSKDGKDHTKQGEGYIYWDALRQVIDAKAFEDGTKALKLNATDRFYRLVVQAAGWDAVVPQCDLRRVGKTLNAGPGDIVVGYLGAEPFKGSDV